MWGTAATVTASILGGAHIVRVHDVAEMAQVAKVVDCILEPRLASRNQ
jgi:2-amino-4-hydroxy-6-hydroxymethyldihydropteridine diphosphokinase/dihydropteroate synthase